MKLFLAFCLIGTAAAAGRDECPMTCSYSPGGLIQVEHDASSSHTQHRCFVSDQDECECECRESDSHSWIHQDLTAEHCVGDWTNSECSPACDSTCKDTETFSFTTHPNAIGNACAFSDGQTRDGTERTGMTSQNCVGSWSTSTCTPACGETCTDTETFSISQEANSCGTACDFLDGATRNGQQRTGDACPAVCAPNVEVASFDDYSRIKGSWWCDDDEDTVKAHSTTGVCKWESTKMAISHDNGAGSDHGYNGLKVKFDYREKGSLDSDDYAKVELRVCTSSSDDDCGDWTTLSQIYNDLDTGKNNQKAKTWSDWETKTSEAATILDGHKYVQVQLALKSDHHWTKSKKREYQEMRAVHVVSECS